VSKRGILDTCYLIGHWRQSRGKRALEDVAEKMVVEWAGRLIEIHETDAIVTPVVLEMLCGVMSKHELELTRSYLSEFDCVDGGDVRSVDWVEAKRLASRVPRDPEPRDLGDCLIRAIANRLGYDVFTTNTNFPR
jgi:predicted nucleic acid-binding protein